MAWAAMAQHLSDALQRSSSVDGYELPWVYLGISQSLYYYTIIFTNLKGVCSSFLVTHPVWSDRYLPLGQCQWSRGIADDAIDHGVIDLALDVAELSLGLDHVPIDFQTLLLTFGVCLADTIDHLCQRVHDHIDGFSS